MFAVSCDAADDESLRGSWRSSTPPCKPLSHDRLYYFLPIWDEKPGLYIRLLQPDHRRRMYLSNALARLGDTLEEGLQEVGRTVPHCSLLCRTGWSAAGGRGGLCRGEAEGDAGDAAAGLRRLQPGNRISLNSEHRRADVLSCKM